MVLAVAIMNAACRQGGGPTDDFEQVAAALTSQSSSWGFEVLWATTAGTASSSTVRTQGQSSLQLTNFTFAEVTSPASTIPPTAAASVGFDLWIPTPPANLNWFGGAELFISCPSQNVNHAFVGYRDISPFPQAAFATVSIALPASMQTVLQAGCSSMQIGIALSVAGGGPYRLDNLRVNPVVSPPTASILGMERTLDWTPTTGTLTASTLRTEGLQGLSASGFNYTELRAAPVKLVGLQSKQVGFDVMVPTLPSGTWPGEAQLFISAPSRGINHLFVGQVPFSGLPAGQFRTVTFTLSDTLFQSLQGTVTDLGLGIALNVSGPTAVYRLDNVRFNPSRAACGHSDGFAPAPGQGGWNIYDNATPSGMVTTSSGTVTLATRGSGFATGGDGILYFYQPTSGDLDTALTFDVPGLSGATAGLMLRSALFPTAPFAFVGVSAGKLAFIRRVSGTTVVTSLGAATTGAARVRLAKVGAVVTAYASVDGITWNGLGTATLPSDGQWNIGLAAASGNSSTTVTASFHDFQLLFADGCGRCGDGG